MNINRFKEMASMIRTEAVCSRRRGRSLLDAGAFITYRLTDWYFWDRVTDMPKVNVDQLQTFVNNTLLQQGYNR